MLTNERTTAMFEKQCIANPHFLERPSDALTFRKKLPVKCPQACAFVICKILSTSLSLD